jgi:hypothetical protein
MLSLVVALHEGQDLKKGILKLLLACRLLCLCLLEPHMGGQNKVTIDGSTRGSSTQYNISKGGPFWEDCFAFDAWCLSPWIKKDLKRTSAACSAFVC